MRTSKPYHETRATEVHARAVAALLKLEEWLAEYREGHRELPSYAELQGLVSDGLGDEE